MKERLHAIVVTPTTSRDDALLPAVLTAVRDALSHSHSCGYRVIHQLFLRRSDNATCERWNRRMPATQCIFVDEYARGDHGAMGHLFAGMLRNASSRHSPDFVAVIESDMLPPRDALTAMLEVLATKRADVVGYPWQFGFMRRPVILTASTTTHPNLSSRSGAARSLRVCNRMPRFDLSLQPAFWLDFGCVAMVASAALQPLPCVSLECPGGIRPPGMPAEEQPLKGWRLHSFDLGWMYHVARAHAGRTLVIDRLVPHRAAWRRTMDQYGGEQNRTWPSTEEADISLRDGCVQCVMRLCSHKKWRRDIRQGRGGLLELSTDGRDSGLLEGSAR